MQSLSENKQYYFLTKLHTDNYWATPRNAKDIETLKMELTWLWDSHTNQEHKRFTGRKDSVKLCSTLLLTDYIPKERIYIYIYLLFLFCVCVCDRG